MLLTGPLGDWHRAQSVDRLICGNQPFQYNLPNVLAGAVQLNLGSWFYLNHQHSFFNPVKPQFFAILPDAQV
jgi:hypothetical protein